MAYEKTHAGYLLSDDPAKIQVAVVKAYLQRSYWAQKRLESAIDESLRNSLLLGLYAPGGEQVGFLRMVTDYATFGWLCDVFVLEEHRGQGLSKAALEFVHAHPRLQTIARFMLGTRDAHELYQQFGYTPLLNPERMMERRNPAYFHISTAADAPKS